MKNRFSFFSRKSALLATVATLIGCGLVQANPSAVATFESIGLRWKTASGAPNRTCTVHYRAEGSETWKEGLPLWFDTTLHIEELDRNKEYRGSLVHLQPDTVYEIRLRLPEVDEETILTARTWAETFPVARTIQIDPTSPQPIRLTEGGSPEEGYVLYTAPEGTVFDGQNTADSNLVIAASYVIVRGLTLTNARVHGIQLEAVTDVVIEQCEVTGWGRIHPSGYGYNINSAVYSDAGSLERIIIQDNHLHTPRSGSNSWLEEREHEGQMTLHPIGPQAITFKESAGNHVIRRNLIESTPERMFNDGMGAFGNFSYKGFPGPDSDIYDNRISQVFDDAIEAEGGGINVRIWGNFIDEAMAAIGAASISLGPQYIFRNTFARSRRGRGNDFASTQGYLLVKLGNESTRYTKGKIYIFHNTMIQPEPWPGGHFPTSGGNLGIITTGDQKRQSNITSRNNILTMRTPDRAAIKDHQRDPSNDFDYDLYYGTIDVAPGNQKNGIFGKPVFDNSTPGKWPLLPESPGYDAAERLPNFNDNYTGEGPDMGAFEAPLGSIDPTFQP
jgi:hypothetical protein